MVFIEFKFTKIIFIIIIFIAICCRRSKGLLRSLMRELSPFCCCCYCLIRPAEERIGREDGQGKIGRSVVCMRRSTNLRRERSCD